MMHNVPVQSLIDHIKTAIDVDPWAKEMVEELLKEQEEEEEEEAEIEGSGTTWFFVCGNCHTTLADHARFCQQCGKKVKWT